MDKNPFEDGCGAGPLTEKELLHLAPWLTSKGGALPQEVLTGTVDPPQPEVDDDALELLKEMAGEFQCW